MRRISTIWKVLGGPAPADQRAQQQREQLAVGRRSKPQGSVHFCGGCGAGFLVDGTVAAFPVDVDGTAREFCACCQDFLGDRLPSTSMARTPGYDEEGQVLNARFPGLTPTEKRQHRGTDIQILLEDILRASASRLGVRYPDPLFLAN